MPVRVELRAAAIEAPVGRMKLTPQRLMREIKRIDPKVKPGERTHETYMILLAGLAVGPNIKKIAHFLGLPREKVAERGRRLRKNGVWVGARITDGWFAKDGGITFIMDACVAEGLMTRRPVR